MDKQQITTEKAVQHIKESLRNSCSYSEYSNLIEELLEQGKSTTKDAGEEMVYYSQLGLQRMKRWDKRLKLNEEQEDFFKSYDKKRTWLVISEGWCGDAAHCVPVMNKIAEIAPGIELRIVLREENPDLMNDFLTNGGKSIPKLILYDAEKEKVEATWGPRPQPAQDIFLKAKEANIDFETYEKDLQMWYNKDKGKTMLQEIIQLLE